MVRSRPEALAASMKTTRNAVNTCQLMTRTWFDAPSAGDRDHDKDADANDGWLSEPKSKRHLDRNPPAGVPLYFKNRTRTGPAAHGHRCMSRGGGNARSTDMLNGRYAPGITSNATIAQIEAAMNLIYVGWSETITGLPIPLGSIPSVKPAPGKPSKPTRPAGPVAPTKEKLGPFTHLDSSKYMNYWTALDHAKALDIDGQKSANGTGWGLHWGTVARNHLHDPKGLIKGSAKIASLTDAEIGRLRGPAGQVPRRLSALLTKANRLNVRVELEVKVVFADAWVAKLMNVKSVRELHEKHLLVVKTLAQMPYSIAKLTPWHKRGCKTMLSFTGYKGKGISKKRAFPIVDIYRGTAKWAA